MSKTKADITNLMQQIFKELDKTREAGQKEYAHDSENAFGNFERLSAELGISREMVLWVYTRKHLDGIVSYINGHKSQREDARGRVKDVIVYLILLWGMVDDNETIAVSQAIAAKEIGGKMPALKQEATVKEFHEPKGY